MGATVSVAKLAAAFKTSDGTIGYALFEQAYSKNSYPHSPRWGCLAIGTRAEVLHVVFSCAACFEDGILQSNTGEACTEDYISAWLDELAMPFDLPTKTIALRMGKDNDATICSSDFYGKDRSRKVLDALEGAGYGTAAARLEAGETVTVDLSNEFTMLRALFSVGPAQNEPICPTWRVLSHQDVGQTLARTIGIPKVKLANTPTLALPQIRKLQSPNYSVNALLIQQDAGHFEVSWRSYVEDSIRGIVAEAEITRAGTYAANIKALRAAAKAAPPAESAMTVEYSHAWIPPESADWVSSDLNRLAAEFGGQPNSNFRTTWAEILDKDHMSSQSKAWEMARLPCSRWYPSGATDLFTPQNDTQAVEAA